MDVVDELPDDCWEKEFLYRVLHALPANLPLTFLLTQQLDLPPDDDLLAKTTCVVLVSDEKHSLPIYADSVFMTFKQYVSMPHPLVRSIPLGVMNGFVSSEKSSELRQWDVSFMGKIHAATRSSFYTELLVTADAFNCYVNITESANRVPGCNSGLSVTDYAAVMGETKIALVPDGYISPETFRAFEALCAGCVPVTLSRRPISWFYQGWPAIELPTWTALQQTVGLLLSDAAVLRRRQEACIAWWHDRCSPVAVARYMAREIALHLTA